MTERDWRPRYIQVAEALREKIRAGEFAPGAPMQSETELAQEYNLSRTSVRNAIRQLREWGLVRAEQGRGTFVRAPRQRVIRRNTERHQYEKDRVKLSEQERRLDGGTEQDTGLSLTDLRFDIEYRDTKADEDLASAFGVPVGTALLHRTYRIGPQREGVPLSISHSYLVREMIDGNADLLDVKNEPWPGATMHQLYTVGIEVDRVEEHITARPPQPDEAEALDVEPGVSVLAVRKIMISTSGNVVEVADVVMPGDRTELVFKTQLRSWGK